MLWQEIDQHTQRDGDPIVAEPPEMPKTSFSSRGATLVIGLLPAKPRLLSLSPGTRLRGNLLLRGPRDDRAAAERLYRKAISVAAGQQAKSLELRAA
jgi:hypothetical protein